ncbi:ATP-dependent DNA helicase YKU70 KNAG_0M02650 [Huiozyma naganishii CBS 8797]|uniref:DNA helicase n=1 Tax=Huiozyma naganishii (strain ATCC MYA-139 / BCRC 22969 / CBS 8797 / KCTC 17520 / NBRC 10181 / NCYC 3082 / Yp74L-3) TaxID=1071383 RepID=J7RT39_HUIN7|nr:hypothetical protein KNAG_0M02650 [Kazachstania naganishii CBS 8797]CCK73118.1 hypothetical protein KNAG_0M02650 [Kazachstania naganishii CBS 8797]
MTDLEVNKTVDGEYGYKKYDTHEGILFCIELTGTLFEPVESLQGRSNLLEILYSLKELMYQLVIVRPGSSVGCIFHYTDINGAVDGVYEFLPLRDVNAKDMKTLSDFLEDIEEKRINIFQYFKFDGSKHVSLERLFQLIGEKYSEEREDGKKFTHKRAFLFTDNDAPPESNDTEATRRISKIVDDLDETAVSFTTFFIGSEEAPFDNRFYSNVLKLGAQLKHSDYDGPSVRPITGSDIKARILRGKEIKRTMFQCPLYLNKDSNFIIGIRGYAIVTHEKYGTRYKLTYEKEDIRQEAFSKRKYLNSKTGEEVDPKDISKVIPYGDVNIELSAEALQQMRASYEEEGPFMKVLGFRSTDLCVKYFNNIDKPSFIVPDELQYEGSIKTLASLFRTLRSKNKSAIIWGKPKSNSNSALYIMVPSHREDRNDGFYMHRIPFLDELRKVPIKMVDNDWTQLDNDLLTVTETILKYFNLRQGYIPSEFKNPGIQNYYKVLHDYILQVEEIKHEGWDFSQEELLRQDDTLKKISHIRGKIEASNDSDKVLSGYMNMWNLFYKSLETNNVKWSEPVAKKAKI